MGGYSIYKNKERLYAYFAGAIDSDGLISIQKTVRKNKSLVPHEYFSAKIELTSGDNKLVLDLLKKNFGGSVYTYQPGNPRHRAWSVWRTSDKHARDILTELQPFLIAKKPQADAVIDFVNICEAQWEQIKRTQNPPYHILPEMLALRDHYWQNVTALNSAIAASSVGMSPKSPRCPAPPGDGVKLYSSLAIAPALTIWLQSKLPIILSQDLSLLVASL